MDIFDKTLYTVEDDNVTNEKVLLAFWLKQSTLPWYNFWSSPEIIIDSQKSFTPLARLRAQITKLTQQYQYRSATERAKDIEHYSANLKVAISAAIEQAVLGSEKIPSVLRKEGERILSLITRKLIEEVQQVCQTEYYSLVDRNLAQMLIFARDEIADSTVLTDYPLPVGTRFVYRWGDTTSYVIEQQPQVRTIIWDDREYRLSFPFCIFILRYKGTQYQKTYFYFRNESITNGNDPLFLAPLPDISDIGSICFPNNLVLPPPSEGPAALAHFLQTVFWNSNFRSEHWGDRIGKPIGRQQWLRLTADDPYSILGKRWIPTTYHVNQHFDQEIDAVGSMAKLAGHNKALARRIATTVAEKLIEKFTAADIKIAQEAFSNALATAIKNTKIPDDVKTILKSHMTDLPKPREMTRQEDGEITGDMIVRNFIKDLETG